MVSTRFARAAFVAALAVLLFPSVSFAQTSAIAGVVTDATAGVLPGVTVEAASPDHQHATPRQFVRIKTADEIHDTRDWPPRAPARCDARQA